MKQFTIGNLQITSFAPTAGFPLPAPSPGTPVRIAYFLTPMDLPASSMQHLARRHRIHIAVVSGIDWDNDLTPWRAPGVFRTDPEFKGRADQFLKTIENEVIPRVEADLSDMYPGMRSGNLPGATVRAITGVSLSGLFAMYAWLTSTTFTNMGSISGSFWYDGFLRWVLDRKPLNPNGVVYLSLGKEEGGAHGNPRFADVAENTAGIAAYLTRSGIPVLYERTPGNHYAPLLPRLDRMFAGIATLLR